MEFCSAAAAAAFGNRENLKPAAIPAAKTDALFGPLRPATPGPCPSVIEKGLNPGIVSVEKTTPVFSA